jgi:hypothetical protein
MELGEAMGSIQPGAYKGAKGKGFGGNTGENVKRVSGDDVGEVEDYSNVVPGIGGFVGRGCKRMELNVKK